MRSRTAPFSTFKFRYIRAGNAKPTVEMISANADPRSILFRFNAAKRDQESPALANEPDVKHAPPGRSNMEGDLLNGAAAFFQPQVVVVKYLHEISGQRRQHSIRSADGDVVVCEYRLGAHRLLGRIV